MATISVKEKDLSWYYRQRQRGNLVVYMPGLSAFGPTTPVYVYEDNIKTVLGGAIGVKNDYSYYMAESLTKVGIDVLFQRILPQGATKAKCQKYENGYKVTVTNHYNEYIVNINNSTSADFVIVTPEGTSTFGTGVDTEVAFANAYKDLIDEQLAEYTGQSTDITTQTSLFGFSITIDGKVYEYPASDLTAKTTSYVFELSQKTAVDIALTEIEEAPLFHTVVKEEVLVDSTVEAKYKGSLGNAIRANFKASAKEGLRYVTVYLNGIVAEQFTVDFLDPMSKYYYENIEDSVRYISFGAFDEFDDQMFNGEYTLLGGKDYGMDVDPINDAVTQMKQPSLYEKIVDPYGYYFDVLTNGGLYNRTQGYEITDSKDTEGLYTNENYAVDVALKNVADAKEGTGTSVYLISGGEETTEDAFFTYCGSPEFISSSFVSAIGPWCYSQLLSNGVYAWLPGWYAFLVAWGNSVSNGTPVWYAPAGVQRAKVGSVVRKPKYEIGETILNKWQNQSDINFDVYKLNPIMNLKQYGYCVYGNSTLLANKPDGSTSMLQSLGTRVLVNQIKAKAFEVALGLQFDQLTDNLFMAFKIQMGSYMDMVKYQGGLYDYEIILDRSTVTFNELNQRTVPVMIRVSPNPAAEKFNIMCEVYPAGITFTDEFDETSVIA